MKLGEGTQKVLKKWEKYKYVLLVALVGLLLLLWPASPSEGLGTVSAASPAGDAPALLVEALEGRLERALSKIEGAGEVTVVLTVEESSRRVLAQDGSVTEGDSQVSRSTSTVMASQSGGVQTPVELQEVWPVYRGALVVAAGADDPQLRADFGIFPELPDQTAQTAENILGFNQKGPVSKMTQQQVPYCLYAAGILQIFRNLLRQSACV